MKSQELLVRVLAEDADDAALAKYTWQLRGALLQLDVDSVSPLAEALPVGTKGVGEVLGALVVRLGAALGTLAGLRLVLETVRDWSVLSGRTVEVAYGDDVLKLTRATKQEQKKIVDDFLARHAPAE
ncbi:hypothetical protein Cs7R123_57120 [Catellatospora sp. TT07R-123]|uniref:hypothetical protein n=1 Tax=Catellatospora sp. TT07R-123 TaxID=2733863 RepID=UPI001B025829|nr:hypothetical protein [Catellatospora sp. TT07R-123]GHJ48370.1 hypothetical protein Cs7R123_57120 [Catellatospora sp. TT07R-123]